jgi:hypothetical protein
VPNCPGGGPRPASDCWSPGQGRPEVGDRWSGSSRWPPTTSARVLLFCILPTPFLLPPTPKILHMWSTLPHWLQHMPTLSRLLLETSNIHKICETHVHKKFQNISKNSMCSRNTNQNRFVRRTDIQSFRG